METLAFYDEMKLSQIFVNTNNEGVHGKKS